MKVTNKALSKWFLFAVFITTVVTAGIDLYSYKGVNYGNLYIQRQFGNEIKFNFLFIVIIVGFVISVILRKKRVAQSPLKVFLSISIVSLFFQNGKDMHLVIIGAVNIIKYWLLYYCIVYIYKIDDYKKHLRKCLELILIIESIGGVLQTFFGINIPFLTSRNVESYRGNMLRMTGTMLFSADFALLITFIVTFFLCDYFFNKNKKSLKYIILCIFDVWFAGSRTMIIVAAIIFAYNYMKRYKHKPLYKMMFILCGAIGGVSFLYSGMFANMFVSDNFALMFSTRLVHWRIGIEMILQQPVFGVGLNNSVLYANLHPEIVRNSYTVALEPISFFFTNPIHSSIIIMIAELGIIGGISYIMIFIEPVIKCIRRRINADKMDCYFIISEGIVLIVYALQGWGSLREHGMVLMTIFYSYFALMKESRGTFPKGVTHG